LLLAGVLLVPADARPQVTADERAALNFIFSALEDPSAIDDLAVEVAVGSAMEPAAVEGMTRQERRTLEREAKKAMKKGQGRVRAA
jgi:hypothetical protein